MLAPYQSEHETLNSNLRSSVFGPWGFGVWSVEFGVHCLGLRVRYIASWTPKHGIETYIPAE